MDEDRIIYNKNDTIIEEVELECGEKWVKKTRKKHADLSHEGHVIERHLLGCRTAVRVPPIIEWYGDTEDGEKYWYIMEKYDGNLNENPEFHKKNWKRLLIDVVSFFKHLHIQGYVHGDIKDANILYREFPYPQFNVCDYEFVGRPDNKKVCQEGETDSYYYMMLGCERGKPYFSYRADLTAFGYILWKVLERISVNANFMWQRMAIKEYNRDTHSISLDDIDYYRAEENRQMPPFIEEYFKIVETIDWFQEKPPDWALYDDLMRLPAEERNKGGENIYYRKKKVEDESS